VVRFIAVKVCEVVLQTYHVAPPQPLIHATTPHKGMIICKDDRDYDGQTQAIQTCLTENPVLSDRLIRIKKQNQPKAKSPVFVYQEYARYSNPI
jgi:hypothetical protein